MGVTYAQVEPDENGGLDLPAIRAAMKPNTRVVAVQRSRGYSARRSLTPEEMEPLAQMLHTEFPHAIFCFGIGVTFKNGIFRNQFAYFLFVINDEKLHPYRPFRLIIYSIPNL